MMMRTVLLPTTLLACLAFCTALAGAAETAPATPPPATAGSGAGSTAEITADMPGASEMKQVAEEALEKKRATCQPLSDQAVSADLKAALAQSQKKELQEIGKLYDDALRLWTSALDACEGKDKERARRNLADTGKARDAVALVQGAGVQCEASNRDAAAMHELARQASSEKRWAEAAIYFRKTANMWDMASERCSGTQAKLAQTRREQSEIDAHNAEFCAPLFEQARDRTQAFKSTEGSINSPAKQDLSRGAEVQWRIAAGQCRGGAAEVATANAQRLARERGSPLPAGMVPVAATPEKPVAVAAASPAAAKGTTPPVASTTNNTAAVSRTAAQTTQPQASAQGTPAPDLQVTVPGQASERMAGTTRLIGVFKSGPDGAMLNGVGKVIWADGSVFEGAMVDGQRTGTGKFVWPSGQSFEGEWRNDTPMGNGLLRFANGDRYEGAVVDGMPTGAGKMQYAQGDVYNGDFTRGQPDGKGTFIWKNGNRYTGQWVAGMRQGSGVYTWNNGDQWIGEFSGNQQTGNGKLVRHVEPEKTEVTASKS
jgi:hypothetical protein